jgi:hypothetical protein
VRLSESHGIIFTILNITQIHISNRSVGDTNSEADSLAIVIQLLAFLLKYFSEREVELIK